MLIQKETAESKVVIKAYQPGRIQTNLGEHNSVICIRDSELTEFKGPESFKNLNYEDFEFVLNNPPEILIIGTGSNHQILPIRILGKLNEKGIAVESMASRQACHTFMVLEHDQRRVDALIYP